MCLIRTSGRLLTLAHRRTSSFKLSVSPNSSQHLFAKYNKSLASKRERVKHKFRRRNGEKQDKSAYMLILGYFRSLQTRSHVDELAEMYGLQEVVRTGSHPQSQVRRRCWQHP
jgi:hypothetical protein